MQLPLLLLVDLLHTGLFEQCVATFRRVRLEEWSLLQVGSTDVDVLLGDVVHGELLRLLVLLGSILSQLERTKGIKWLTVALKFGWLFHTHSGKSAHLQFESLQLLLPESVEEFFPAQEPLLHGKLGERVRAEDAVAMHHAQSASSPTGNTGESLAPWEEEHRHLVKCHVASPRSLGFL